MTSEQELGSGVCVLKSDLEVLDLESSRKIDLKGSSFWRNYLVLM